MKKIMKNSVLIGSIALTSLSVAAYIYSNRGLDTNSDKNFDGTLETMSREEMLFNDVADLISSFVKTQRDIRENIYRLKNSKFRWSLTNNKEKYTHILEDLPNEGRYASRDVHRKTHGCYQADFTVNNRLYDNVNERTIRTLEERTGEEIIGTNLLPELLTSEEDLGVFRPDHKYQAIVRLSNGNPGNKPDKNPDARGFAVKLLPGSLDLSNSTAEQINGNTMLDILTINFPTFFVNSASKYFILNKWFLKSTEDNRGFISSKFYESLSVFAPRFLKGPGLTKLEKTLAFKVNGSIINHPLYEEYFSMVPSRLGKAHQARAVKYVWTPVSCNPDLPLKDKAEFRPDWSQSHDYAFPSSMLTGETQKQPPYKEKWGHYYLRDRVKKTLAEGKFCYDLSIQLYRDQLSTNIEDSMDIWLSSEQERTAWLNDVAAELGDNEDAQAYKVKIHSKKLAPRIKVGRLEFRQLSSEQVVGNSKFCEDLSFNPWHGNIEYHKPLGQVSRMKQKVYNTVRRHRHQLNGINSKSMERAQ